MQTEIPGIDALIVVDVQRDFLPGGAVEVPDGDRVIEPLNRVVEAFVDKALPVFATRDDHPNNHVSFESQGGPWPPHCVSGTEGAEPPDDLELPDEVPIVHKGTSAESEAYSGFQGTELGEQLEEQNVSRVFVGGLATDYCVLQTVLDALDHGLEVVVLEDAIAAVDAEEGDAELAIERMERHGAEVMSTDEVEEVLAG